MVTEGKGTVAVTETRQGTRRRPQLMLSGFAALAESVWMGAPQASDVLEILNLARSRWRQTRPRLPRLQLAGLLTRELSIAEASFVLMASFFFSALLGAVRQVLHGKFDSAAGSLTYSVLVVYAFGLPAYVSTEAFTRGLISLRDIRTPLLTNTVQLLGRVALMTLLLPAVGVLSIPSAFAATAAAETVALGLVLLLKLQRRSGARLQPA